MKGFSTVLETKNDYLNSLELYPEQTRKALKSLYADRYIWMKERELEEEEKGIENDTHRVFEEGEGDEKKRYQYVKKVDSKARVYRLGFTDNEIQKLL